MSILYFAAFYLLVPADGSGAGEIQTTTTFEIHNNQVAASLMQLIQGNYITVMQAALSCSVELLLLVVGAVAYRSMSTAKSSSYLTLKHHHLAAPQRHECLQKRRSDHVAHLSAGAAAARDKLQGLNQDERKEQQTLARFTRLIHDCTKLSSGPERAWSKIREMSQMGLVPNQIHYGAAIAVCAKHEAAHGVALGLLAEMRQINLKPDAACYNAAITACGRAGQCEICFRLLSEMKGLDLTPGLITFNAMIDACAKAREHEKARQLLVEMRSVGINPTVTSYGAVINAYARVNNWLGATELLDEMERFGVVPNVTSYSSAMNACAKVGNWQESLRILRSMQLRDVAPNQICYSTCISACLKGNQRDMAIRLFHEMKAAGIAPDGVTYQVLLKDFRKRSDQYSDFLATLQAEHQHLSKQSGCVK
jgi:pentatricopeptide repeat protein